MTEKIAFQSGQLVKLQIVAQRNIYIYMYIYIYIYSRLRRLSRLIVVRVREEVDEVRFVDWISVSSTVV